MAAITKARRQFLASATRTATTIAGPFTEQFHRVLRLYLNVTAASGTGGLTVQLRGYDPVSGVAAPLNSGGGAITAIGMYVFEFGLAESTISGAVHDADARPLPTVFDVQVTHGDATNYTYSLGAEAL
jgi:hypothetical protein